MSSEGGKFVWRVYATDGAPADSAFDALVLPVDTAREARLGMPPQLLGIAVPYETELADTPVTLVVRARNPTDALIVECEAFGADGKRQVYGRATQPLSVIVRSATGVLITGLPSVPSEPAT